MVVGNRALLVLSQTQEVHEEIEDTLDMLRRAGGLKTVQDSGDFEGHAAGESARPARPAACDIRRPAQPAQGAGGMGGMGGMGGGMGGMGGELAWQPWQAARRPLSSVSFPDWRRQTAPGGDADLLEGLKSSNAANQKAKVLHLKQRQDAGQKGEQGVGGGSF